jgi:hypothetical protein
MGSFARDARDDREQLDFQLMLNSSVQKFWSRRVLENALGWLRSHGYRIIELPAADWRSETDLHLALEQRLSFPSYYGRNLGALDECMSDFALYEFGSDPHATGTVLVMTQYDVFVRLEPDTAYVVLDIIASASRRAMLIGHRMLCLVQTDDPRLEMEPVGSEPVMWNQREFFDTSRGL